MRYLKTYESFDLHQDDAVKFLEEMDEVDSNRIMKLLEDKLGNLKPLTLGKRGKNIYFYKPGFELKKPYNVENMKDGIVMKYEAEYEELDVDFGDVWRWIDGRVSQHLINNLNGARFNMRKITEESEKLSSDIIKWYVESTYDLPYIDHVEWFSRDIASSW